jgi:hypothetical protein
VWERKLRKGKLVDQMAFYGSSLILPKLSITRETSFPALTAFAAVPPCVASRGGQNGPDQGRPKGGLDPLCFSRAVRGSVNSETTGCLLSG